MIYNDYISDWYKIYFGSSVGTVRIICFRGSGKPVVQDKTTPHAKPIYVFIYTESMNVCIANPRTTWNIPDF